MDQSFKASMTKALKCSVCGHGFDGRFSHMLCKAPPLGPQCVVCGNHTRGPMGIYGMGQAHISCIGLGKPERFYFSHVSDGSEFIGLGPGVWAGTPATARFAARWLNAALDFWRNW